MELPTEINITSHRPVVGQLIVLYKKIVGFFVRPFLRHVFEAQNAELNKRFLSLEQQLKHLGHQLNRTEGSAPSSGTDSLPPEITKNKAKLDALIAEAQIRARACELANSTQSSSSGPYDDNYEAFQQRFRGQRQEVLEKQAAYIPHLKDCYATLGKPNAFFLDIGCGRGELLELLKSESLPARGIDLSSKQVSLCQESGLAATRSDCFEFLQSLNNASLCGVISLQVVEHLTIEQLKILLKLCFEKTMPKGKIILETVNPLSVYAMKTFLLDSTHEKALHPEMLKFLVESTGYHNVEIHFRSPVPEHIRLETTGDKNLEKLDEFLFGYRDYAVVADR